MKKKSRRHYGYEQVSAGGVVFKADESGTQICLVGRGKDERLIWCLPKGHVEAGEQFEEAALREVKEESGIESSIQSSLGTISYRFYDAESERSVHKSVHFYLVRYLGGSLDDHDDEVVCAKWFSVQDALRLAEYAGERIILEKAVDAINALK